MGARGRFFVTPHAVRRYIERVRRGLTYEQALSELVALTARGRKVREYNAPSFARAELWRGPRFRDARSRLRFLVAFGSGGELPQVVTILPVGAQRNCK